VLGLIAEQLRTPAFSAEEFAKVKKQLDRRHQAQPGKHRLPGR
jgi:hypothetical protein